MYIGCTIYQWIGSANLHSRSLLMLSINIKLTFLYYRRNEGPGTFILSLFQVHIGIQLGKQQQQCNAWPSSLSYPLNNLNGRVSRDRILSSYTRDCLFFSLCLHSDKELLPPLHLCTETRYLHIQMKNLCKTITYNVDVMFCFTILLYTSLLYKQLGYVSTFLELTTRSDGYMTN